MYQYYTTPVEPQERVRTMETLNMSERFTTTTDDVYEVYVKRKDVKHKWIQTEDFDQGSDGLNFNISKWFFFEGLEEVDIFQPIFSWIVNPISQPIFFC